MTKKTVLSGFQATGTPHLGNYIGALSVWAKQQAEYDNLFFVANLHALTIPEAINPEALYQKSRQIAALYLACGLNPQQSTIFLQSDVAAHPYLSWLLCCLTPVGWLERMTQYKSKAAQYQTIGSGLLMYPVLQAADILIYRSDYVPVGDDQRQHLELTRDVAQRFNHLYGEYFPLPEALIRESGARIMGLDDPEIKMSKSVAETRPMHAIGLLDSLDLIRKKIMAAVTDTSNEVRFEHASAGVRNLLVIYETLTNEPRSNIEAQFNGKGYGNLKREVATAVIETLRPIQEKYHRVIFDEGYLDAVLCDGAEKASAIAERTLEDVKQRIGISAAPVYERG